MWNKGEEKRDYSEYIPKHLPESKGDEVFLSEKEFTEQIIKRLPNWKAAGIDGVYNFFIKYLKGMHGHIYRIVRGICIEGKHMEDWLFTGITYLLPKGEPKSGGDFRPITCMSNLYKIVTKCVTIVLQCEVEKRGLLAENQLGTVKKVQRNKRC